MGLTNLTKKNQEFIHIATNQLTQDGKSGDKIEETLEEVLPTIAENQKKGLTACALFGVPTVWATSFTEKASDKKVKQTIKNDNPRSMWLDTSSPFIGVTALLNAVTGFFNSTTTGSGLPSLPALGFSGGAAIYVTYHSIYRHSGKPKSECPGWVKTVLVLVLAMFGWALLYAATAFLPAVINPQLPAIVMLIIGAAALLGRYFLQGKYNIFNAMTPQR